MFLVIFLLLSLAVLVGRSAYAKMLTTPPAPVNPELDEFYAAPEDQKATRIRQLIRAAAYNRKQADELKDRLMDVQALCDQRLLSVNYYNRLIELSEELALEKFLIEQEAEAFRPELKETLHSEAAKVSFPTEKKRRGFDEAVYAKRYELFLGKRSEKGVSAEVARSSKST